jgi:hypothetical protein
VGAPPACHAAIVPDHRYPGIRNTTIRFCQGWRRPTRRRDQRQPRRNPAGPQIRGCGPPPHPEPPMSHVNLPRRRAHPGGPQGLRRGGRGGTRSSVSPWPCIGPRWSGSAPVSTVARLREAASLPACLLDREKETGNTVRKTAPKAWTSRRPQRDDAHGVIAAGPRLRGRQRRGPGRPCTPLREVRQAVSARRGSGRPHRRHTSLRTGRLPLSLTRAPRPAGSHHGRAAPRSAGARPGLWPARPPAGRTAAPAHPILGAHARPGPARPAPEGSWPGLTGILHSLCIAGADLGRRPRRGPRPSS